MATDTCSASENQPVESSTNDYPTVDGTMVDGNKNYLNSNRKFICGVVEGFYGRPWTAEQRKELFSKMERWGMTSYLYAPKDDYKHRAFWRDLYTVEEAEHLTSLIQTAQQHGVSFVYGLSPGIDITYSSQKELAVLRRKLDQVAQFGCRAFALLFDDIDTEMREDDKQVFQSFAHAQVAVTNEMSEHLNRPDFLFCPTQYCATRALPTVSTSEYLQTIGSKLAPNIDIMWTGPKVVSKVLTVESIDELSDVLRRPPVIWDNIHANDYDQKRLYMGPYSGRSVELKSRLRGVLTNPNCEFGVNFVAIRTLSLWSLSTRDAEPSRDSNDPLAADIRLETEADAETAEVTPTELPPGTYHPRHALRIALREWLPEFNKVRTAPCTLPQRQLTITPGALEGPAPVPLPGINTCMAATAPTVTTTVAGAGMSGAVKQLQALAEAQIIRPEDVEGVTGPVLNSLADAEKIVVPSTTADVLSTLCEPMECNSAPASSPAQPLPDKCIGATDGFGAEPMSVESAGPRLSTDPLPDVQQPVVDEEPTSCMQVEPSPVSSLTVAAPAVDHPSPPAAATDSPAMSVEEPDSCSSSAAAAGGQEEQDLTEDDLLMMADLFYLPFEHGRAGLQMMHDFQWLKTHSSLVTPYAYRKHSSGAGSPLPPEVREWYDRAEKFDGVAKRVTKLLKRLFQCENRSLLYDIYAYMWDVECVLSQLNGYVKWLVLGCSCSQVSNYVMGNYTWFTRGWKESFTSGDSEPWIFRGGLTGDLERLLPVDHAADLLVKKSPEHPIMQVYVIRPYRVGDETAVAQLWSRASPDTHPSFQQYPQLSLDRWVSAFLVLQSEHCLIMEDDEGAPVGFMAAAPDAVQLLRKESVSWLLELRGKYPLPDIPPDQLTPAQECIAALHGEDCLQPPASDVLERFPGCVRFAVTPDAADCSLTRRLLACSLATLRASGCFGAHCRVLAADSSSRQQLSGATFPQIEATPDGQYMYYGRNC